MSNWVLIVGMLALIVVVTAVGVWGLSKTGSGAASGSGDQFKAAPVNYGVLYHKCTTAAPGTVNDSCKQLMNMCFTGMDGVACENLMFAANNQQGNHGSKKATALTRTLLDKARGLPRKHVANSVFQRIQGSLSNLRPFAPGPSGPPPVY